MEDKFERYIQGKFSKEERIAFEAEMTPTQKEEAAFELGLRGSYEEKYSDELRKKVVGFENKHSKVRRINPAFVGIAASLFLVASLVLYFNRDQSSLFDQYYEVYPNYELTSLRGEDDLTIRQDAYLAYDKQDYEEAIASFDKLDTMMASDHFFKGISLMELKNEKSAIEAFNSAIQLKDKNYTDASIWYTALIYLKLEKTEDALPILEELSKGKSEFAKNAEELLDQL